MKRGKFESQPVAKKNNGKKIVSLLLVLVLLLGAVVGTTLAWLIDSTDSVKNTFTFGNINITLAETAGTEISDTERQFKLTPGLTVAKDPKVSVVAGSEASYLFVKVDEANNDLDNSRGKIVTWAVDTNVWTQLENNIYYIKVEAATATAGETYQVLTGEVDSDYKDGKVTVSAALTEADIAEINAAQEEKKPSLTFTAYAIQSADLTDYDSDDDVDAADAWALLQNQMNSNP